MLDRDRQTQKAPMQRFTQNQTGRLQAGRGYTHQTRYHKIREPTRTALTERTKYRYNTNCTDEH